ncbi:MAG: isochorismate synthase [Opitutaceae bacterium]|jgi:menaquinone-specific isochorismate synthase
MTILPLDPAANASPEALCAFLAQCRAVAQQAGKAQLVSISLKVDALDPLAVLESIFEPREKHFFIEKPSEHFALAGAEAVVEFSASGPDRFAACQRFIDETLANTLAVGAQQNPFGGPHFFCAFGFVDEAEGGAAFPAAQVFVPRWQVGCRDGVTVATANLLLTSEAPIEAFAERVWRARSKFDSFDYAQPSFEGIDTPDLNFEEVGGPGHYALAVKRALDLIHAGTLEKIVLARAQDLRALEPFHPLRALNSLRERFSECYAFSVANGLGQSFIGASPERLLCVQGARMSTEALAGSTRRGASASEDAALGGALLRDEKDLREHQTVIESIKRRLVPLGIREEHPGRPVLRKLANVQHLHTPVEASLPDGVRLLELLSRLHPTPAVGGSPREAALPLIRSLEGFPRGLYAGAIGWIDSRGGGEFCVGLRSALMDGASTRLYAGAGIVDGSNPDKEFAETELKFRAMRDALQGG